MEIPIPHHQSADNITIKIEHNWDVQNTEEDSSVPDVSLFGSVDLENLKTENTINRENSDSDNNMELDEIEANSSENAFSSSNVPSESSSTKISNIQTTNESNFIRKRVHCKEENCNLLFSTGVKMLRHLHMVHNMKKSFQCEMCPRNYNQEQCLKDHVENVHEKEKWYSPCIVCGRLFESKTDLALHYSISHKEPKPFSCGFCKQIYQNLEDLKYHVQYFHSKVKGNSRTRKVQLTILDCPAPHCEESFAELRTLKSHIISLHGNEKIFVNLECSFCGKKYEEENELILHYSNSHKQPNPFQCAYCNEIYQNREDLTRHTNLHHNVHKDKRQLLECPHCQKHFSNSKSLQRHVFLLHEEIIENFDCSFCGKKHTTEDEMIVHYFNSHKEPNPFQCAFCPELYLSREDLTQHTKDTHPDPDSNTVPKYYCHVCRRHCFSLSGVKAHNQRYHDYQGDKNTCDFKCSVCTMKFNSKTALNWHLFKHMKAISKLHNTLTQSKTLMEHEQLDGSGDTHECKFCGKLYKEEKELNSHYSEAHQSPDPFTCKTCGKKFQSMRPLRNHLKTHDNPARNVKCKHCERMFLNEKNCKNHEKTHQHIH